MIENSPKEKPDLVLYGRSTCGYCRRVDVVIQRLQLEGRIERRSTEWGSPWAADLLQRTGRGQVPCLFIDDKPMFESAEIIQWLHDNFG